MRLNLVLAVIVVVSACSDPPSPPAPEPAATDPGDVGAMSDRFLHRPRVAEQVPAREPAELWCFESIGAFNPWSCEPMVGDGYLRTRSQCITSRDLALTAGGPWQYGPCQRAPSPHCFSWQGDHPGTACHPTLAACDIQRDHDVQTGRSPTLTPCDPMR